MSSEAPTATALTRDFGDEFEIIQDLIDKKLDERGLTSDYESALMGGDIVFAGWDTRRFVFFNLHLLYEEQVPKQGTYDKDEVLGQCINQALRMADFLKLNLYQHMQRIVTEAWLLSGSHNQCELSETEARDLLERRYRYRFPRGRPKHQGAENIVAAYEAILEILRPGFNRLNKAVTKMSAAFDAVDWCLENKLGKHSASMGTHRTQIADELWLARKPETAAVKLLSQAFSLSESTVKRRVGLK